MNEQPMPGTGYLIVRAATAGGAIPLEGATVVVRGGAPESSGVIHTRVTDRDGRTERIALSAPPAGNSEAPDNGTPYAVYQIDVSHPGYLTNTYQNVPIFDRITAVQTAELLPVGIGDTTRFYESENPLL